MSIGNKQIEGFIWLMNRFSRIRHHVDMKDVKKRHLEETAAKKLEEKRLKEEAEQIKAEYEKWKSN